MVIWLGFQVAGNRRHDPQREGFQTKIAMTNPRQIFAENFGAGVNLNPEEE